MRCLILLSFLFASYSSFGQIRSLDNGGGDYRKLATAVTVLGLIEKGNVIDIYKYTSDSLSIDAEQLVTNIRNIAKLHPYKEGSSPCSFIDYDSEFIWYERTYFKSIKDGAEYKYQVYLELTEIKDIIKVTQLEFRTKSQIKPRTEEIRELDKVDDNNPPPPPAPSGLK